MWTMSTDMDNVNSNTDMDIGKPLYSLYILLYSRLHALGHEHGGI